MIQVIGKSLSQWDLERSVRIVVGDGQDITYVDFAARGDSVSQTVKVVADGNGYVAKIPNIYLQNNKDIMVYAVYEEGDTRITVEHKALLVRYREKPAGYVYTETEVYTVRAMVDQALAEAKERGDFKGDPGAPGKPPVKGEDYFTPEDQKEMVNAVLAALPRAEGVAF